MSEPLLTFAVRVLDLLETTEEWDSDTLDRIGLFATELNVAHLGEHGLFAKGPQPDPAANGSPAPPAH